MSDILQKITLVIPDNNDKFKSGLQFLYKELSTFEENTLTLNSSNPSFLPTVSLKFENIEIPFCKFEISSGTIVEIPILSKTGENKITPHQYKPLTIDEIIKRFEENSINLTKVDHFGFNLPWFEDDIHTEMLSLRNELKDKCLYHLFPTGEAWDFIIPGKESEVEGEEVDYTLVRKPKFEIVSFDKSPTPLIQMDVDINISYEECKKLFPEAYHDPELKNMWVSLENSSGIDIYLVLNEIVDEDWSMFFKESRLK